MLDVAIIGGGLCGLSLAQRLKDANRSFCVFESRERFGGRIVSVAASPANHSHEEQQTQLEFKFDLGPSWIWPEFQPRMAQFITQNNIKVFPQWSAGKALYQTDRETPPQAYVDHATYEAARRIHGGSYRLVETLIQLLPADKLKTNHHLREVTNKDDHVELHFVIDSSPMVVNARQVVITIPPRLLVNSVSFMPMLDERLRHLMNNTATWMAGHAKAVIRYPRAFWREADFSGNALASYPGAALAEVFDASSPDANWSALGGFFALPAALRRQYRGDLSALILDQLVRLFGKEAAKPDDVMILDWFDEPLTATSADEYPPTTHPQYGHNWFQLDHWSDKLYFSGTETASQFGGYLEGAFEAAERVAKNLLT